VIINTKAVKKRAQKLGPFFVRLLDILTNFVEDIILQQEGVVDVLRESKIDPSLKVVRHFLH